MNISTDGYVKATKTWLSCLDDNERVKGFILLHLTDFDPFGERTKPYVIDYIYTYPKYRRRGLATSLIGVITEERNYGRTALCDNDIPSGYLKNVVL